MALLKALQRSLTCVESRWSPAGSARTRRLINEMVLEEESDEINGVVTSHFELYRAAMAEAGANTRPIDGFLGRLAEGSDLAPAMSACGAPAGARAFVDATFATIASGRPHAIALLEELCGEDPRRWEEAGASAANALTARIALWDRVDRALPSAGREAKRAALA